MPPATPPSPNPTPAPAPKAPRRSLSKRVGWDRIQARATVIGSIAALFVFLVLVGGVGGFLYEQSRKSTSSNSPAVQNLSQSEIDKLTEVGANLGTAGQTLNIGANALFRGKVDVGGDLSIGGHLNANGPVTLSQLNITGTTAATGLNVGSNLIVSGTTNLQKALVVGDLATFNSGVNIAGAASINTLSANTITVHNIVISGPLAVSHLATQGATPFFATGAVGAGGTVSISGNDTAGTININTGGGPSADTTLITVTFRAAYGAAVHVLLTPTSSDAAATQTYVIPTNTGFRVLANNPTSGETLSYSYFVTQ